MPAYSGNSIYLAIDGYEMMATWKKINLEPSVETTETTRGAGTTHKQRNEALGDTKIGITLGYNDDKIAQHLRYLKPGKHQVSFGPEGAVAGKPKHVQDFIFTAAPFEIVVEKGEVAFEISGDAVDKPIVDMFSGGVF